MKTEPLELPAVAVAVVRAAKTQMRFVGARLSEHGLQAGQDHFLKVLWHKDGLSQSEMLEHLHVEPPTLTKALARLEKQGLVTRKRDPKDARVSRVFLTAKGRKLREPVKEIWREADAIATADMSGPDRETLVRLCEQMMDRLAAVLKDES